MSKQMQRTWLPVIGSIRDVVAEGSRISFVTEHSQADLGGLHHIDAEKNTLTSCELPGGGVSLAFDGESYWIGGSDAAIYRADAKSKSSKLWLADLDHNASTIIPLPDAKLALLCDGNVLIVSTGGKKAKIEQTIELPESGAAMAIHAGGQWMAVGTTKGSVLVFQREDQDEFLLSDSEKLHQGAVTSLLFEPEELRFWSAGADLKLLLTHARGKLEPEDRGRSNNHDSHVNDMLIAGDDRFITASGDKTCKSWAIKGATKPATLSDGIVAVEALAIAEVHGRRNLVAQCGDQSLRLFLLNDDGRIGQPLARFDDGYSRAKHLFESSDAADRGAAMHELAGYGDAKSLEVLASRLTEESDHKLRLKTAELLTKSDHADVPGLLEPHLSHQDDPVRMLVFEALQERSADVAILYAAAIKSGKPNVGVAAISALEKTAKSKKEVLSDQNRARQELAAALKSEVIEIHRAALFALERVHGKTSARPAGIALDSGQTDSGRTALIRLQQREQLKDTAAQSCIRRAIESNDGEIRQTGFLVSLLSQPKLADAVRFRNADIHRLLHELETTQLEDPADAKASKAASKKAKLSKAKKASAELKVAELEPLLVAASSRQVETCLLGARCLAALGDARALGVLLQISREDDPAIRVGVCKALSELGDARANDRLCAMLEDEAVEVRDAAFTALAAVSDSSISAAENGLCSSHPDIRLRGLHSLVAEVRSRKKGKVSQDDPVIALLILVLSDQDESVRKEAFKSVLNANVGGDQESTLRIALASIYSDVRHDVLVELIANDSDEWAQRLKLEMFNDNDSEIRDESFSDFHRRFKKKPTEFLPVLKYGIESEFSDIRKRACRFLSELKSEEAEQIVAAAINDEDESVREVALSSLVRGGSAEMLVAALDSRYPNVQLTAADALANQGDIRCRDLLLRYATAPIPEREERRGSYLDHRRQATAGMARLGDPSLFETLMDLARDDDFQVASSAIEGLAFAANEDQLEQVQSLLKHENEPLRNQAAFVASILGGEIARQIVLHDVSSATENQPSTFLAAIAAAEEGEAALVQMADGSDGSIAKASIVALVCRDLESNSESPKNVIALLAANDPGKRLFAADLLVAWEEADKISDLLIEFLNERGNSDPTTIEADTFAEVSDALLNGPPRNQIRAAKILLLLCGSEDQVWKQGVELWKQRLESDAKLWPKSGTTKKKPKRKSTVVPDRQQLAFGAWVGLVREHGSRGSRGHWPFFGTTRVGVRCAAIRKIVALAKEEKSFVAPAVSVLMHTSGGTVHAVAILAFEGLGELGVEDALRAQVVIESGSVLFVDGLKLLTESATKKEATEILTDAILQGSNPRNAELAAYELLELAGSIVACKVCQDAGMPRLAARSVSWVAKEYESKPAAKKLLHELAQGAPSKVRDEALSSLVGFKDKKAFDGLMSALSVATQRTEVQFVCQRVGLLQDPRSPEALLDFLEEPENRKWGELVLPVIGNFRDTASVDRLLELSNDESIRDRVFDQILKVSGFDQRIMDPNDTHKQSLWLKGQLPRHGNVLATLAEKQLALNAVRIVHLIPSMRWCQTLEVDEVLGRLVMHPNDDVRNRAVEAISFRGQKRSADVSPLRNAVEHKDPLTQFVAAEGLAKAGDPTGQQILMAAVEMMDDLSLRRRAVLALGNLGQEQSLDMLLKLVNEEGHALQASAAEAIGHLGKGDHRQKILDLLTGFVDRDGELTRSALVGLRWMDDAEAWQCLREFALTSGNYSSWQVAVEQLGHDDSEATQETLIKLLEDAIHDPFCSMSAARESFGEESIAPDVAFLKGTSVDSPDEPMAKHSIERVCNDGNVETVFELIEKCPSLIGYAFADWLMKLDPLPLKQALKAIESKRSTSVRFAAQIIGTSAESKHSKVIGAALKKWRTNFEEARFKERRGIKVSRSDRVEAGSALATILRAAGQLGSLEKDLLSFAVANADDAECQPYREFALEALSQGKLTPTILKGLESLTTDFHGPVRSIASRLVAENSKKTTEIVQQQMLSDRYAFGQMARSSKVDIADVVVAAAPSTHYQVRALPHLISNRDVSVLAEVASDSDANTNARLGAIEGLAVMGDKKAEKILLAIGKDEAVDEELRKAAWRALRRSKRTREKQKVQK